MPGPYIQCTYIIQATTNPQLANAPLHRTCSISDTFIYQSGDFALAKDRFNDLCLARAALLGRGASIVAQRFQQIEPTLRSQPVTINYPSTLTNTIGSPGKSIRITCVGDNGRSSRQVLLACVPDDYIDGGEFNPTQAYRTRLNTFCQELVFQWRMRALQTGLTLYPIWFIRPAASPNVGRHVITVSGSAFPTLVKGQLLKILRSTDAAGRQVGDVVRVFSTNPTELEIIVDGWLYGTTEGGNVRLEAFEYPDIDQVTGGIAAFRKVGAPFLRLPGRRSRSRRRPIVAPAV